MKPVSGMISDWFSLGLTIVDSIDTAYIMGLHEGNITLNNLTTCHYTFAMVRNLEELVLGNTNT